MPEISEFKHAKTSFVNDGGILRDGDVFITFLSSLDLSFDENAGILWADLCLEANESAEIILSFGKGKACENEFEYDKEKQKTIDFWKNELSRLSKLPKEIKNNKEKFKTFQNLTVQLLQCFSYYVGEKDLVLRQGGLQRLIWPWEAMPAIDALSRIGEFSDYIEPVLSFYFDVMHRENGEISNVGEGWASVTSSALCSLVRYCNRTNNKALWERYRSKALKTFEWIKNKRHESDSMDDAISGLFPPMRGSDWPHVLQHWTVTDCYAVVALEEMSRMMKKLGDPDASAVCEEYESYKSVIRELFKKFAPSDADEIRIPLTAHGNDAALLDDFYPYLHQAMPLVVLKNEIVLRDVERLYAYMTRVNLAKNGLYSRMPYKNGNTHIWYTNNSDYDWFLLWNHFGIKDQAQKIIEAQFKYSMTDEYYMVERYADNDPYYVPWSPNVSAMGRLICMMTDFCNEKE